MATALPETGFLRLPQIVRTPAKTNRHGKPDKPETVGVYPVSRSTWLAGVRAGRFPKPVKLGPRTTAWRAEDIKDLIEATAAGERAP